MAETPSEASSAAGRAAPDGGGSARWAQRGVGHRWQFGFFDALIRFLGKRPAYHLSYVVTLWYVLLRPGIRRRARYYLSRRFPERRGGLRRLGDAYRLVRCFGTTMVDMAAFGILGEGALAATCPDHARLMALCQGKRGMILVNAHVGCWQLGLSTLGNFPKRVSVVMVPEAKVQALLDRRAGRVIDARTGLAGVVEMTEALLAGEIVALMGDRTFGADQNTVEARLLGGVVRLPLSPYRLASATGAPVVVLLAPKTGYRSYELHVARVINVPLGLGRQAEAYAPYAQEFADCVERFVEEYPWQFFNFFDLWGDGASATLAGSGASV